MNHQNKKNTMTGSPPLLPASALILSFIIVHAAAAPPNPSVNLTIVNNCPYTIWPAIQPNGGHPVLQGGGFALPTLAFRSFPFPSGTWSGRVWGRTQCAFSSSGRFTCITGDCMGRLDCNGFGGDAPATLAQFNLRPGAASSYGVSLVDGFNLPMTITPQGGNGQCPVVGCRADLLETCPAELQRRWRGTVVGCRSGCATFGTDETCCRNKFAAEGACRSSQYTEFFKRACPATFTYAQDRPALTHLCTAPFELKVIFCQ